MIGTDIAFRQILDEILTKRSSPSLSKLEKHHVIKSKPYGSKNKEVKPQE
jgi:hypothetical protein